MARRYRAPRRPVAADPKYNNEIVARLINKLMLNGKKTIAAGIIYKAFDIIESRTKKPPMETFDVAIKNATPLIEVRPRRVGGATYQVPLEVRPERRISLALRWLVQNARARSGKSMAEKLAAELMDAANNQGNTVKKREDTHRMAEANRAFAHYRW